MVTSAKKSPDGKHYVLNGAKKWVTQGKWADYGLVAARTGPPGAKGISIFIVPLETEGISRWKIENSGVSSSGMFSMKLDPKPSLRRITGSTYIEFDEVLVPTENMLGPENHGFEIIMSSKDNAHTIHRCLTSSITKLSRMNDSGSASRLSDWAG
jgi:alkylation response protein AidB-like acyl-CoA dehydrogenase